MLNTQYCNEWHFYYYISRINYPIIFITAHNHGKKNAYIDLCTMYSGVFHLYLKNKGKFHPFC